MEKATGIDCGSLAHLMNSNSPLLILDIRPTSQYLEGAILGSIHLCIPATLLKRKSFTFANIESTLNCKNQLEKFKARRSLQVVFVDQEGSGSKKSENSPLGTLLNKFLEEQANNGNSGEEGSFPYYLQGGLLTFQSHFPLLCETPQKGLRVCRLPITEASCPAKPEKTQEEPARITDYLYLGDQKMASDWATLEKYKLTFILNTAAEIPNYFENHPSMHYMRMNLCDSACQLLCPDAMGQAFGFIEQARQAGQRVLVHCQAGQSRSASIVIAYIIHSYHFSLPEAYKLAQSRRSCVAPNLGFMAQLTQFEKNAILGRPNSPGRMFSPNCVSTSPNLLECIA